MANRIMNTIKRTLPMVFIPAAVLALASQPDALGAPEINPDSSATFRLRAPDARTVELRCEGIPYTALAKGDDGVWTFTTAPLAPDIYAYSLLVDGVRITDPANPHLKYNLINNSSELIVPSPAGAPPKAWERTDAPRGALHRHSFKTKVSGDDRDFIVYTPPGYDPADASARYPVLYLLHGYSDDATAWTTAGRADIILDNLIAAGKARPMIVVMPLGYGTMEVVRAGWQGMRAKPGLWEQNIRDFTPILLDEVLPRVEAAYCVSTAREDRAIAGLSMGGAESLNIGLNHIDKFAWIGAFSSGGLPGDLDAAYPHFNSTTAKQIRLLWIACGNTDQLLTANDQAVSWLKDKAPDAPLYYVVTDLGHTFRNWRRYLAEFAPMLFKK
ncbi:enterochelin esterase-like enzyme [Ereboglobus sp. PH5-10]|nr:enterochelin esterase-like enzyme [Ereboglobus sp. PH5-10]